MGKIQLQKFEIVLGENKRTYQLGDEVSGKCIIALEGELQLSMIRMEMIGMAEVKWSENKGTGNHRRTRTYRDNVKYLGMGYDFVRNTFNAVITKGIHEFPFSYQLPKDGIPSSFDGYHGTIKYWIEAEIEKPMFSFNHKTKTEFEVEAPLIFDNLMLPISGSNEKSIGFLWMKSGNISANISVVKRGFSLGEFIAVNCSITNKTAIRVSPRATLKQTQTFMAKGKQKVRETKFVRIEASPIDPGLTNVETIMVPIPANIPLSIECPLIMVSYEVHITAEIPSALNLHIDLPIVITTESVLNKSTVYCGKKEFNADVLYVQI